MVDHGDTACQTPDAATYIAKVRAHQAKQVAAKPKVKAKAAAKPKPKPAAKPKPKSAAKKRR